MKKIYTVHDGYEFSKPVGYFSTRKKAQEYIENVDPDYEIEEHIIDELYETIDMAKKGIRRYYVAMIKSGEYFVTFGKPTVEETHLRFSTNQEHFDLDKRTRHSMIYYSMNDTSPDKAIECANIARLKLIEDGTWYEENMEVVDGKPVYKTD